MASRKLYTPDDNRIILELHNDYPEHTYVWLAQKMHSIGLFKDRNAVALTAHISRVITKANALEQLTLISDTDPDDETDTLSMQVEELKKYKSMYEALLSSLMDGATLFDGEYFHGLKLDVRTAREWVQNNETVRFNRKIDELLADVR